MIATVINCITIICGCIVGLLIKGKMTEKISSNIVNGLGLCVLYIGISGSLEGENTLITIISIALGALVGQLLDIDKWLSNIGDKLESKFSNKNNEISISQGFVSSSLLFCVGAMAIVGSLQSGLNGNNEILLAKSVLDGISAIIFAATLGIGVIFSAVSVFIYQGSITICAIFLSNILSDSVVVAMSAVGSLLIIGLGLNMLKVTDIKVANLLPSIIFPLLFSIIGML